MSDKRIKGALVAGEVSTSGVLVGTVVHALDPKKRLTIPSNWRAVMGDPEYVYVMPDRADECLDLVPAAEMELRLAKLRERALTDPATNRALEAIGAVSEQLALDVQGRIRICDDLLAYAHLDSSVQMVGGIRMIKLRAPAKKGADAKKRIGDFRQALAEVDF